MSEAVWFMISMPYKASGMTYVFHSLYGPDGKSNRKTNMEKTNQTANRDLLGRSLDRRKTNKVNFEIPKLTTPTFWRCSSLMSLRVGQISKKCLTSSVSS
jgi:hypothetical protein